jgi:hypothetical protein
MCSSCTALVEHLRSDTRATNHLVILAHGMLGSRTDWTNWQAVWDSRVAYRPQAQKSVLFALDMPNLTLAGIEALATEANKQIEGYLKQHGNRFTCYSIIAHSLGGIYTKRMLTLPNCALADLTPLNYVTLATPHLSSRLPYAPVLHKVFTHTHTSSRRPLPYFSFLLQAAEYLFAKRTGQELFLADKQKKLVAATYDCVPFLFRFRKLMCFANTVGDWIVPYGTALVQTGKPNPHSSTCTQYISRVVRVHSAHTCHCFNAQPDAVWPLATKSTHTHTTRPFLSACIFPFLFCVQSDEDEPLPDPTTLITSSEHEHDVHTSGSSIMVADVVLFDATQGLKENTTEKNGALPRAHIHTFFLCVQRRLSEWFRPKGSTTPTSRDDLCCIACWTRCRGCVLKCASTACGHMSTSCSRTWTMRYTTVWCTAFWISSCGTLKRNNRDFTSCAPALRPEFLCGALYALKCLWHRQCQCHRTDRADHNHKGELLQPPRLSKQPHARSARGNSEHTEPGPPRVLRLCRVHFYFWLYPENTTKTEEWKTEAVVQQTFAFSFFCFPFAQNT